MPELPEVEVLVRHLARVLPGRGIRGVQIRRARAVRPDSPRKFADALRGCVVRSVRRRAKYLVFELDHTSDRASCGQAGAQGSTMLLGHLGMTGRMYVAPRHTPTAAHASVVFDLGDDVWVFEDPRTFGRMTLDASVLDGLGPEPLGTEFSNARLAAALRGSRQSIKVKLLDQAAVAGLGNIYASEALFLAGIRPDVPAGNLDLAGIRRLRSAIRRVLTRAIRFGSTVPLDFQGEAGSGDGLFYYGSTTESAAGRLAERLLVYDRMGKPCVQCGAVIRRVAQAGRSTYYCPQCQY